MDYSLRKEDTEQTLNGLHTAEKILADYPTVKIMMLTMHDTAEKIVPCITSGVHGYMLKSEKNADFSAAFRLLNQLVHYFSPDIAKDLAVTLIQHNQIAISLSVKCSTASSKEPAQRKLQSNFLYLITP